MFELYKILTASPEATVATCAAVELFVVLFVAGIIYDKIKKAYQLTEEEEREE